MAVLALTFTDLVISGEIGAAGLTLVGISGLWLIKPVAVIRKEQPWPEKISNDYVEMRLSIISINHVARLVVAFLGLVAFVQSNIQESDLKPPVVTGVLVALSAAGLAACHKALARVRKVCTKVALDAAAALLALEELEAFATSRCADDVKVKEKRFQALRALSVLEVTLRTNVDVGHLWLGLPPVSHGACEELMDHARTVAWLRDPSGSTHWTVVTGRLAVLHEVGKQWSDVSL